MLCRYLNGQTNTKTDVCWMVRFCIYLVECFAVQFLPYKHTCPVPRMSQWLEHLLQNQLMIWLLIMMTGMFGTNIQNVSCDGQNVCHNYQNVCHNGQAVTMNRKFITVTRLLNNLLYISETSLFTLSSSFYLNLLFNAVFCFLVVILLLFFVCLSGILLLFFFV